MHFLARKWRFFKKIILWKIDQWSKLHHMHMAKNRFSKQSYEIAIFTRFYLTISISVTFWWLWLPSISVDLLFLLEIHLWFCSLCCILKVGYFVIPILCLQSAQSTKVGPKVSQVLHICHPLLPVPLYLQREDTVHRT